jgi:hypothetical protein
MYLSKINSKINYLGAAILVLIFVTSIILLSNRLNNRIDRMHNGGDEIHTIIFALDSLDTNTVETLRVGESTRWLARIFTPLGIYYMNSKMGGEHYLTGWDYSGLSYLKKNFKSTSSLNQDANIQDFVFALKMQLGILVIASFLLASFFLLIDYGAIAAVAYFSLAISATLVEDMLLYFYTESTLLIIFNLILVLGLLKNLSTFRGIFWGAFIGAFGLSTKLTGVAFFIPLLYILSKRITNFYTSFKLEVFIALCFIFLALINIYSDSYINLIDQTLANVYHLKTGHYQTEPTGMFQIKKIVDTFGVYGIIFATSLLALTFLPINNKKLIISIAVSYFFITIPMVDLAYFHVRNFTTPLVIMILIFCVVYGSLLGGMFSTLGQVTFITILIVIYFHNFYGDYKSISYQSLNIRTDSCQELGYVDIENLNIPNAKKIQSMPREYILKQDLTKISDQFSNFDCIIVNRIKNNKHYTNYILPMKYSLIERKGNYFLYQIVK